PCCYFYAAKKFWNPRAVSAAGSFPNDFTGNFIEIETPAGRSNVGITRKIVHFDAATRSVCVETPFAIGDFDVTTACFDVDRSATILSLNRAAAGFSVERSLQVRERHAAAAGVRLKITGDIANAYRAAVRPQFRIKSFGNPNRVFGVCFAVTKIPVLWFVSARANRDYVSFFADGDWRAGEIFFLFRFVAEVDFAMRFERDFAISARTHVDCSEIDIDNQLFASDRVDLAIDIFFGSRRSSQRNGKQDQHVPKNLAHIFSGLLRSTSAKFTRNEVQPLDRHGWRAAREQNRTRPRPASAFRRLRNKLSGRGR